MVPIRQMIVPPDHEIRPHLPMAPEYITIHETGNPKPGADALMHGAYISSQAAIDAETLWHYTVDDHVIVQHLPWNEVGWHAGDGRNGPGNRNSIGIEICVNADGDFARAQLNAAGLVAYLCATVPSLRPFPECVVQHYHWTRKDCPQQIRRTPGGWEKFLARCAAARTRVQIVIEGELRNGQTALVIPVAGQAVPVRPLMESLGFEVGWTQVPPTVTIRPPQRPVS